MTQTPLPSVSSETPFFVVLNAASGADDVAVERRTIEGVLTETGRRHTVLEIEGTHSIADVAAEAVERARAEGGAVIAAGGDGTINAVAQAVLGSACPFGVIPQGTFNYFSRTHGISAVTADATRALTRAHISAAQVGLVNGKVFLVNASLGLYPKLLEEREATKQRFGRNRVVAFISAIVTLLRAHRPLKLGLVAPGIERTVRSPTLFIANNALQLERIGITDEPLHGQLVAMTSKPVGSLALFRMLLQGALGKLDEAREVEHFGFVTLEVRPSRQRSDGRVKVATDGEVSWMETPLRFSVSPESLALLTPAPEDAVERK